MLRNSPAVYLLAILCAMIVTPAQAVQRAFVASYGLDSNTSFNCNVTHPCRWFATAVTMVNPDGEVVALDTAAYGTVTLSQSISLTAAPGIYAGISVFPSATGVTIATPGVNVVLRGLTINGQGGDAGILMTDGAKLSIENCVISNFNGAFQHGIFVNTAATVRMVNTLVRDNYVGIELQVGATAAISGSKFFDNIFGILVKNFTAGTTTTAAVSNTVMTGGNLGIYALADVPSAIVRVEIVRSIVSNTDTGVAVESQGGTASVIIRKSMVTGNSRFGLAQFFSGATLISYGENTLSDNFIDIFGILTTAALL